ncbi:hypothetical protein [Microbacterium sp. LWH12-1.2]|uniref:hypothetical protein n=1 Tax=Microbacterium sp. LWH12-1.2 TaxID=3135259 RepID=UPI003438B86C
MADKDDRLFAPFPIEMDEHPKIIGLSDPAFRAIFEATFYSRRMLSDGFLDERVVLRRWGQEVADELASNDPNRPSWIRVEGGWQIHDFEKHHPLKAEIMQKRADVSAKRSEAGRIGAAKRWQGDSKPMANHSSETETETETREEPLSDADASDRIGSLIPADWRPNQTHIDKAASLHLDVRAEYQRFRAHAERTQRRLKSVKGWNTGFTNWLRKAAEFNTQRQGRAPVTGKQSPTDRIAAILAIGEQEGIEA